MPRADLVLFVTSADRPFTETERAVHGAHSHLGQEGRGRAQQGRSARRRRRSTNRSHSCATGVERLLGFRPDVFPVSARLARGAGRATRTRRGTRAASSRCRHYVSRDARRARPAGAEAVRRRWASRERIARTYVMAAEEKLALLAADLAAGRLDRARSSAPIATTCSAISRYRLSKVDNILHEMSARGRRLPRHARCASAASSTCFARSCSSEEFERIVVADAPERIDRVTQDLIDWMVDQDLRLWRTVTEQVERRRGAGHRRSGRAAGRLVRVRPARAARRAWARPRAACCSATIISARRPTRVLGARRGDAGDAARSRRGRPGRGQHGHRRQCRGRRDRPVRGERPGRRRPVAAAAQASTGQGAVPGAHRGAARRG